MEHIAAEWFNSLRLGGPSSSQLVLITGYSIGGKARGLLRTAILNVNLQLERSEQEKYPSGEVINLMSTGLWCVRDGLLDSHAGVKGSKMW